MRKNFFLRITIAIAAFVLLVILLTKVMVEPWVARKIATSLNDTSNNYLIKFEKVHISLIQTGIEFESITLIPKRKYENQTCLNGEIESVTLKGINLRKAIFKKDIVISEVDILNCRLIGNVVFQKGTKPTNVSPFNIRIKNVLFDTFFIDVKSATTAEAYSINNGILKLYDINIEKQLSLSSTTVGQVDFEAFELKTITPDSLYTILADGLNYSGSSNVLKTNRVIIQPNYSEYEFAALNYFETDRFEVDLKKILCTNFSVTDYFKSRSLSSSYIEIGEMHLNSFRDKRKVYKHIEKPTFQDMMYNYHGRLNVDSIRILGGNIIYSEHAEKANEKGSINFDEIDVTLTNITNDPIYKTQKAFLTLNANALLMGKSKMNILLEALIFDPQNTFAVNGSLSEMEASALNPLLEKNAFISITSGKINSLDFSFSANNTNASGSANLLYEGLNFVIMNKQNGNNTTITEKIKSLIANKLVIDSNPMPGKDVRLGIINYERDPEKFLFNYSIKAITSGITSSILIHPRIKKK